MRLDPVVVPVSTTPREFDPPLPDTVYTPATRNAPDPTGATPFHRVSTADTNAAMIKPSGGVIHTISAFNTNASVRFLKLYDVYARPPVVGTDPVMHTYLIPPSNGGFILSPPKGIKFLSGLGMGLTANINDSDATAVGANDVTVEIDYL